MRILVTGGAGYLGCRLVPMLLERGHLVRVYDRFCFGEEPVAAFRDNPQCELIHGDIRRFQEAPGLFEGIEAIIHLASLANDPSCLINPDMGREVNVECTRELASLAVQHGIRRFVFASSCSVYGKGVFDVLDETSSTNPVSLYGETKRAAEEALLALAGNHFEPVIARPATVYGYSPRMRFDLAVNQMTATAVRQGHIDVYGGGQQRRAFVHIHDACHALALLAEAPSEKVAGQIFNIGAEWGNFRVIDLAERVGAYVGNTKVELVKGEEDPRSYNVRFQKIRDTLGFECEAPLEQGIEEVRGMLADGSVDPFAEAYFNLKRMRTLLDTPVDEGGEPVVPRFLGLYKPTLGSEEENAVVAALRGGWLTSGPNLPRFESAFGETVGAPHVIGTISCTSALHLCLAHLGVGSGDEVITSPITWASTANTITHMGAKPIFADVQPETLNLDPAAVEAAVSPRTKAIMPVHLAGQPCDMEAIQAIAHKHGIPVVEDAAHALGATYKGKPIGGLSEFTCFSFYAIKNITTMEGGTVCCLDPEIAQHIRLLATNGMAATAWDRYGRSAAMAPDVVVEPGFKYLMGNVQAGMGIEQLKKFPDFLAKRRRLARLYHEALRDIGEIRLPQQIGGTEHAWHLMVIQLDLDRLSKTRDEIRLALRRENVGTGLHFYGLHLHPYYAEHFGLHPEDLPSATAASNSIMSLPFFPLMTDRDVHNVVEALKKVLRHARKVPPRPTT